MTDHLSTLKTGLLGTGTSLGAAAISLLPHLEQWMRLGSLVLGLIVATLTILKLLRDLKK
jgi:hypothetical protein